MPLPQSNINRTRTCCILATTLQTLAYSVFCWETPNSVIHEDYSHKIPLAKHCYTPTKTPHVNRAPEDSHYRLCPNIQTNSKSVLKHQTYEESMVSFKLSIWPKNTTGCFFFFLINRYINKNRIQLQVTCLRNMTHGVLLARGGELCLKQCMGGFYGSENIRHGYQELDFPLQHHTVNIITVIHSICQRLDPLGFIIKIDPFEVLMKLFKPESVKSSICS